MSSFSNSSPLQSQFSSTLTTSLDNLPSSFTPSKSTKSDLEALTAINNNDEGKEGKEGSERQLLLLMLLAQLTGEAPRAFCYSRPAAPRPRPLAPASNKLCRSRPPPSVALPIP